MTASRKEHSSFISSQLLQELKDLLPGDRRINTEFLKSLLSALPKHYSQNEFWPKSFLIPYLRRLLSLDKHIVSQEFITWTIKQHCIHHMPISVWLNKWAGTSKHNAMFIPIHIAYKENNFEIITELLSLGDNIDEVNIENLTLLQIAIINLEIKNLKFLLEKNANISNLFNLDFFKNMYAAFIQNPISSTYTSFQSDPESPSLQNLMLTIAIYCHDKKISIPLDFKLLISRLEKVKLLKTIDSRVEILGKMLAPAHTASSINKLSNIQVRIASIMKISLEILKSNTDRLDDKLLTSYIKRQLFLINQYLKEGYATWKENIIEILIGNLFHQHKIVAIDLSPLIKKITATDNDNYFAKCEAAYLENQQQGNAIILHNKR